MYRNTAQIPGGNVATTTILSPPNDKRRDRTDHDVSRVLAEKRRQTDEEIANFRALKEKEFQDFERDLLRQRQRRKKEASKPKDGSSPGYKEKAPNALSLLGVLNQSNTHMNGSLARHKKSSEADPAQSKPLAPPSQPTLSLDKLNIRGETTPPLTADGSPPSPSACLQRQFSRSPPTQSLSLTPPRQRVARKEQGPITPPTPINDHTSDNFAGIFSPAYLPLLDSRDTIQVPKPTRSSSFSLPPSSSASASISPVSRKNRALTAPLLPSNSLPSALRTASGTTVRKRKHVTFQLADSAIVEPSSSYEEGPSPMREDDLNFDEKIDHVVTNGHDDDNDEDHKAAEDAEDEEPKSGLSNRTIRSPMIAPKERHGQKPEDQLSPKSSSLEVSVEGDSGIGFFELDEELASPGIQSYDAKFIDDDMEDVEKSAELRREDGDGGGDDDDDDDGHDEHGWSRRKTKLTYEYSGSVPIDIVRPSGSWIGSFGH